MKIKFLLLSYLLLSSAYAQVEDKKLAEPEPKIKTGVIASTGVKVGSSAALDMHTTDSSPGDSSVAISGGVSNLNGKCLATLTSASKQKTYRVRFDVVGVNPRGGSQVFRKGFSGSVSPLGKLIKEFDCKQGIQMQLNLKSVEPVN